MASSVFLIDTVAPSTQPVYSPFDYSSNFLLARFTPLAANDSSRRCIGAPGSQMEIRVPKTPGPKKNPLHGRRDGKTFDPTTDTEALDKQAVRVWKTMLDGRWRSLDAIAAITRDHVPSISARIRDFRKHRFGGHEVKLRRQQGSRMYEYQLIPYEKPDAGPKRAP